MHELSYFMLGVCQLKVPGLGIWPQEFRIDRNASELALKDTAEMFPRRRGLEATAARLASRAAPHASRRCFSWYLCNGL